MPAAEPEPLAFGSQDEWRAWLDENHASADEVWIRYAKKASGIESVNYPQALDVALCYGWIDGKVKTIDEQFYKQRFTPRRAKSKWSKVNRDKAMALIESGAMQPAGLAEVERAKADGRWEAAYDSFKEIEVPPDLKKELDKKPVARDFFATLNKTNRYAILYQIEDAKRPETRTRRIAKFVDMLNKRQKLY